MRVDTEVHADAERCRTLSRERLIRKAARHVGVSNSHHQSDAQDAIWTTFARCGQCEERSMPFSDRVYDPETLALMTRVLDETWQAVLSKSVYRALDPTRTRRAMALLIMKAVDDGQRDPDHLKQVAMLAVEGRSTST